MRAATLLLLALGLCSAQAQVASEHRYSLRQWGTKDGLGHRCVNALVKDDAGFLWIGTDAGVDRFDGHSFLHYGAAQGIRSEKAGVLLRDGAGRIWVFGQAPQWSVAAIDVLDPVLGTARPVATAIPSFASVELNNLVSPTPHNADTSIWFGHLHGQSISRYSVREGLLTTEVKGFTFLRILHVLADRSVYCEAKNAAGESIAVRVYLDGRVEQREAFPAWIALFKDGRWGDDQAFLMTTCAAPENCLLRIDPRGNTTIQEQSRRVHVMDPYITFGNGQALAGTNVLDAEGAVIVDLLRDHPALNYQRFSLVDGPDRVWIGTQYGLFQLNISRERFARFLFRELSGEPHGVSCRSLLLNGDTLIANTEQGTYHLDARTGAVLAPAPDTAQLAMALARADDGTVYRTFWNQVGITRQGLSRRVVLPGHNTAWTMLPDFGRIVLLGGYTGLFTYDPARSSVTAYASYNDHDELKRALVVQLVRTRDGDAWACTDEGLYRISSTEGVRERFWTGGDTRHRLPTNIIHHLHEDAEGVLWVASTGGLTRFDRNANELRTITRRDGLPSDILYAIREDRHGHLWISSDRGILRYEKGSGAVRSYTVEDGITHDEFNRISFLAGPDGTMYFGGLNGITAFHPDSLGTAANMRPARLAIARAVQMQGDSMAELPIEQLQSAGISVRPGDGFFEVAVALLSFDDPAYITYDWMIEGVDVAWTHQQDPLIRINRLPYGDHVLRVKARSGITGPALSSIAIPIHVLRPIHLKWWFIALCMLAVGLIVYGVFRYRLRQARALFATRDRIAMDLHDEVGSTLNSIALTASVARKRLENDLDQSRNLLGDIITNTGATVEAMQDIVWAINSRHDDLGQLVARMRAHGAKNCEARDIRFVVEADEGLEGIKLDMAQRKNVYLIFKEALNNALKYAAPRTITLRVKRDHELLVELADDGIGFDPDANAQSSFGGNGLVNMRRRAAELNGSLRIQSGNHQGTFILLRFKP